MSLNLGAIMFPQDGSLIAEDPSFPVCYMPVFVRDPKHTFVRVTASGPTLKLLKQDEATVMEGFRGYHAAIVVCPAMDHLVQFFDKLSLWSMTVFSDQTLYFLNMSFHCFFTRGNDRLEA